MPANLIPPEEALLQKYAAVLSSEARAVSLWHETNSDDPADDEAYLKKALAEGPAFVASLRKDIDAI